MPIESRKQVAIERNICEHNWKFFLLKVLHFFYSFYTTKDVNTWLSIHPDNSNKFKHDNTIHYSYKKTLCTFPTKSLSRKKMSFFT
jgi:hypothetical protein